MSNKTVIGIDFGCSQTSVAILKINTSETPEVIINCMATKGWINENTFEFTSIGNISERPVSDTKEKICKNFKNDIRGDGACWADKYAANFIAQLYKEVLRNRRRKKLDEDDFITIVSHPAIWNDQQIDYLKDCVKKAGFPGDADGEILTIKEPIAALLSLKAQQQLNFDCTCNCPYYLVVDFGGGTLDVALVQANVNSKEPRKIWTAGEKCGGKDIDIIIEKFFKKQHNAYFTRTFDDWEREQLDVSIKNAKEELSSRYNAGEDCVSLNISGYNVVINKKEFEEECHDIIAKIYQTIDRVIAEANVNELQLNNILLTGGSSLWYFMRDLVTKKFTYLKGENILQTFSPFTDVAIGDAIARGYSNAGYKAKGVYVHCTGKNAQDVIELLKPGRIGEIKTTKRIGKISRSVLLNENRIDFGFGLGYSFEEIQPSDSDEKMQVRFYSQTNLWYLLLLRLKKLVFRHKKTQLPEDQYTLYLRCEENFSGNRKYFFIIEDVAKKKKEIKLIPGCSVALDVLTINKVRKLK